MPLHITASKSAAHLADKNTMTKELDQLRAMIENADASFLGVTVLQGGKPPAFPK